MTRYARKPEVIEARQWTVKNTDELVEWTAGRAAFDVYDNLLRVEQEGGTIKRIAPGGYVIRKPNRTFAAMMQDDFEALYVVDDDQEEVFETIDPLAEIKAREEAERERVRRLKMPQPEPEVVDDGKGAYTTNSTPFGR